MNATTASTEVIDVLDADFAAVVEQSDQPVLVDFWAPWCGPCKALEPVMKGLAKDYAGRAKIVKVNIDEATETAARFGVRGIPNVMLFTDGEKQMNTGAQPKGTYARMIDGAIEKVAASNDGGGDSQLTEMLKDNDFRMKFIGTGELDELKEALKQNPEIGRQPFDNGLTPIALAMQRSFKDRIETVLACDPPLTVRELAGLGRTEELASLLSENSALVNEQDADGTAPLHAAVRQDQFESSKLLLERGADPSLLPGDEARKFWPPLAIAVSAGSHEIVQLLVQHGADMAVRGRDGGTLLHQAAMAGFSPRGLNPALIKILLEKGLDKAATDSEGHTALQAAQNRVDGWVQDDRFSDEQKDELTATMDRLKSLLN